MIEGNEMVNERLLEALMADRYGRMLAFARLIQPERADAEDALHEALIATFSKKRRFNGIDQAEAYVRRAIASRGIDEHRRRSREKRALVALRSDAVRTAPSADAGVVESSALGAAMARLSPRERACVALRYVDGMSVHETSGALGISDGAVKRYVSDGIRKLNALLGTQEEVDAVPRARVETKGGRHE